MSKTSKNLILLAATLAVPVLCFGQTELQLRARQLPGWDPSQREGSCEIRVWVDDRAEVRLRGDKIWVTTLAGAKGRDQGSECSQPMPFNAVGDFQVRQLSGRTHIGMVQNPSRGNNYTAMLTVEDRQGGGDNYAFEVTWRAEANITNAPAPFFDDVRACQEIVRQRFTAQNGRGSYVDFETFADRQNVAQDRGGNYRNQGRGRGQDQERIQGRGSAKTYSESRNLTYSCIMDTNRNMVQSGDYQYVGESLRVNQRNPLK